MRGELRVGALDLGTNAVRLRLARLRPGVPLELVEVREAVRVGEGMFATGRLTRAAMERAAAAVARLHRRARVFRVHAFRAVATAAVREARNRAEFVARVARETGVTLEVLSGAEEARLAALGVSADPSLRRRDFLLCDLGGGSTEFTLVLGDEPVRCWSLRLGAVRATERFLGGGAVPRAVARLGRSARRSLARLDPAAIPPDLPLVGCGGTVAAIAELLERRRHRVAQAIGHDEVLAMVAELAPLPLEELRRVPGIDPGRADILVAGAAILAEILQHLGASAIVASRFGLRDGLVAELVSGRAPGRSSSGRRATRPRRTPRRAAPAPAGAG